MPEGAISGIGSVSALRGGNFPLDEYLENRCEGEEKLRSDPGSWQCACVNRNRNSTALRPFGSLPYILDVQ